MHSVFLLKCQGIKVHEHENDFHPVSELYISGSTIIRPDFRENEIFVMDVCDVKLLEVL